MATKSATITVDANLATAYNPAPKIRQKKAQAAMRRVLQESPEPSGSLRRTDVQEPVNAVVTRAYGLSTVLPYLFYAFSSSF
jgi:hypothetical protein